MYPKIKKKRSKIESWFKKLTGEFNSAAVSVKSFLKGKDYLLMFMKKNFHI